MSATTPRGQRGGGASRGTRGSNPTAREARGSFRVPSTTPTRGRGRGRGAPHAASMGDGLLQKLRTGTLQRSPEDSATPNARGRGTLRASTSTTTRGRGHLTKTFNTPTQSQSAPGSRTSSPAPSSVRDFMSDVNARYQSLKQKRDSERAKAIKDGFLADPEKKTTLDKAITPVGTCTEMCAEFERVERIVQKLVDKSEKVKDEGRYLPSEAIMVKRFRRSAAGNDEQLPSDIRTPETLKQTLDYLVDKVIGGPERLAIVHKFVWDRTRAIRNDFSIQQVSKEEDVYIAVECFERIARFHILSMHQLCNPDNLLEGENFDFFQEREQLNNTLLSLMYYYDDNRDMMTFANEAEFRVYCIIFEIQSQQPDLEDRMQSWPRDLLLDKRVDVALKLYRAAGNTLFEQGPLQPMAPFTLAQSNSGNFWTVLSSSAVPYMMACVAEIYFPYIRFAALDAVWAGGKQKPAHLQPNSQDWNVEALTEHLGFDDDAQTLEFCSAFDLSFKDSDAGDTVLDLSARAFSSLDKSKIPSNQEFSHTFVEDKRCRRSFVAIINGLTVSDAIREGLIEESSDDEHEIQVDETQDDGQSFFIPESNNAQAGLPQATSSFGSGLNPQAPAFSPTKSFGQNVDPSISRVFANTPTPSPPKKFGEVTTGPSTTFGEAGASTSSNSVFVQSGTSASEATKAAPSIPFLAPAQPQAYNPLKQATGPGKSGFPTSAFSFTSTSTPTASSTAPSTEQTTASFTNFNFTKPAQLGPPKADVPLGVFQFSEPTAAASASSTINPPSADPSFEFDLNSARRTLNTPQSPLHTFPTAATQKDTAPSLLFGISSQNPGSSIEKPANSTRQEQPSFQSFIDSAATDPHSRVPPITISQPSEPPTSPKTAPYVPSTYNFTTAETSKPPLPAFNFTSSQGKPAEQARPQPRIFQQSSRKISVPSVPSPLSLSQTAKTSQQPPNRSTTPPTSPRQQPVFFDSPIPDKSQLIHHLAHLSLCQNDGLLQEYLEYSLPKMLKGIVKQHNDWVQQTSLDRLKELYLQRKYGGLWRKLTWRNVLNRKANVRRKKFTELLGKEAEKRRRLEQEKDEIIKAVEEKKRLQAEMAEIRKAQEPAAKRGDEPKNNTEPLQNGQVVGKKRKSLDDNSARESTNITRNGPSYRNHKRSRTMGSTMPPPPKPQQPSPPASKDFRFSKSSIGTSLNRSASGRGFGRSSYRPPQDATKTDFFRLLAHGVDPDTPWIPLTAAQVAAKEKTEKEIKKAKFEAAYNRRRVGGVVKKTPTPISLSPAAGSPVIAPPSSSPASSAPVSNYDPESDELLQQLREARKQLAEDTDWLKSHNEQRQKEIEEEERLRSSASSNQSLRVSSNGLPMVNGYEYLPAPNLPSGSMSRVERRIRATGARGFAYKPFGEQKLSHSAVPMSKKSARKYLQRQQDAEEVETNSTARKRRKHFNVDPSYRPSEDQLTDEEEELEELAYQALTRPKGVKHAPPVAMSSKAAGKQPASIRVTKNPFRRLQNTHHDVQEDGESGEDEGDEEVQERYYHNGEDGDSEAVEGEDEEELLEESEDESDEDECDEDDGLDQHHLRATSRPYSDAPTPNTQISSVGATADDPLELSD